MMEVVPNELPALPNDMGGPTDELRALPERLAALTRQVVGLP
jgi:hypothetical protein